MLCEVIIGPEIGSNILCSGAAYRAYIAALRGYSVAVHSRERMYK